NAKLGALASMTSPRLSSISATMLKTKFYAMSAAEVTGHHQTAAKFHHATQQPTMPD
ncbi:hypothetical protein H4R34_006181, partial [Dimargaris verticillata]